MTTKRIVIYHANCSDGLGAAYAAWKKFGDEDTEYIPCSYGTHWSTLIPDEVIPNLSEIDFYIVDFSFPREQIRGMCEQVKSVTIYDHHDTARQDLEFMQGSEIANLEIVFDMDRSGAGITWDELHGEDTRNDVINYIEDRDLWNFEYGNNTKAFQLYLKAEKPGFEKLAELVQYPMLVQKIIEHNLPLVEYQEAMVAEVAREILNVAIPALNCGVSFVNAPYHMASDLGDHIGKMDAWCDSDMIVCIWRFSPVHNNISISLRTKSDTLHCGEICRDHFNGGGHQKAAGGYLPPFEFFEHFMKGIV